MIRQILYLIINQLNNYIKDVNPDVILPQVITGNVALTKACGGTETSMDNKIILSVVNMMEEATLKNSSPYRSSDLNPEIENPPIYINLFLLFSANFQAGDEETIGNNYYKGLSRLTNVIEFFQGKNSISVQNSPVDIPALESLHSEGVFSPELQDICIDMELVSLTFEQVNYLWGSLGGKQLPFVLYKAQVVPVKRGHLIGRGAAIKDIESSSLHISKP